MKREGRIFTFNSLSFYIYDDGVIEYSVNNENNWNIKQNTRIKLFDREDFITNKTIAFSYSQINIGKLRIDQINSSKELIDFEQLINYIKAVDVFR